MIDLNAILDAIKPMRHNQLHNYIAPGLTSALVGGVGFGTVRLFTAERSTMEFITPHSHRFNFTCLVLKGVVRNAVFLLGLSSHCDRWCLSTIDQVCGPNGVLQYTHTRDEKPTMWYPRTDTWKAGDVYSMTHDQIHSVQFDRGTEVLFFEGPQVSNTGKMLEPWENGKVVPTFRTAPWMFEKGDY